MNDTRQPDSIQHAVLEKVRAGTLRRRPRWQFMLRIIATVAVSMLLFVTSAFVISFIIFSLHESGEQFLLGFGWHGIAVFLLLFPWPEALLVLGLLLILEWLLQGFKAGYRVPLLNIFVGIIGISILLGIAINFTPLHAMLLGSADRGHLPVLGESYEHIFDSHEGDGVCRGVVVSVGQNSFTIYHNDNDQDHDDGTFVIHIQPGSAVPLPHVGDTVLVFGDPEPGKYLEAEHIQLLPPGAP
jgi:hypothetical protein